MVSKEGLIISKEFDFISKHGGFGTATKIRSPEKSNFGALGVHRTRSFLSGKEWGLTNTNLRVDPQQLGYTDEHWEFNLESGVTSRTCNEKIQFGFNIIEAGFDKKQKQGFDQRNEPTKEGKIDEGMGS